jgi:glycosyltransferase involved in cell wall biosynthesis
VFLTTTLGEGWGLTYSEAAACKLPIIAPYSTSFMEMSEYGKNGYMLYNLLPISQTIDNVIREQTDIFEVAETLLLVANHKQTNHNDLQQKIERNYNWVKKHDWVEICKLWINYFKEVY